MSKMGHYNSNISIGYVTNFKIRVAEKTGTKMADIGIKDELTNNIVFGTIFESDKMTYNDKPVTLGGLKSIFLDKDDKPRHVLVRATGKTSENKYTNKQGVEVTNTRTTFFKINPHTNEDEQGIVFITRGIVENIKEQKDGEELKLRVGILTTDKDGNPNGIEYNVLVASGEVKDKLEDKGIDKYSNISVAGDILNIIPRDKYGVTGEVVKEMRIMRVNGVTDVDDLDDFEEVYLAVKNGKTVVVKKDDEEDKPKKSKKKYDELDDELDDLD